MSGHTTDRIPLGRGIHIVLRIASNDCEIACEEIRLDPTCPNRLTVRKTGPSEIRADSIHCTVDSKACRQFAPALTGIIVSDSQLIDAPPPDQKRWTLAHSVGIPFQGSRMLALTVGDG